MAKIFAPRNLSTLLNDFEMPMMQQALPVPVSHQEVMRCRTLGEAIDLCIRAAGTTPKEVQADLRIDKAQWSRWVSGQEGIKWEKLIALQQRCGNTAPTQWMCWSSGYELSSLRRQESELERDLRQAREENDALRRVLMGSK